MPALRPYCHPPYKHQASNYELRMRKLRQTLQTRALKIADILKTLDDTDRTVVEMAANLKENENSGKFLWINNAIDELAKCSLKLEPGITQDRVTELVKARNVIREAAKAMPAFHHHHTHPEEDADGLDLYGGVHLPTGPEVTDDLGHPAVPEPVDPPPTTAQVEMAARTRKCLIDMIESLSKPFWPRRPPASANPPSPYKQGGYHPKLDDTHRVDQQPLPPSPKIIRKKIPLPVFVTKKAGEDKKEVAGSPPATKTVRKPLTRPTLAKRAPKKDEVAHHDGPGKKSLPTGGKSSPRDHKPAPEDMPMPRRKLHCTGSAVDTHAEHEHNGHPNNNSSAAHEPVHHEEYPQLNSAFPASLSQHSIKQAPSREVISSQHSMQQVDAAAPPEVALSQHSMKPAKYTEILSQHSIKPPPSKDAVVSQHSMKLTPSKGMVPSQHSVKAAASSKKAVVSQHSTKLAPSKEVVASQNSIKPANSRDVSVHKLAPAKSVKFFAEPQRPKSATDLTAPSGPADEMSKAASPALQLPPLDISATGQEPQEDGPKSSSSALELPVSLPNPVSSLDALEEEIKPPSPALELTPPGAPIVLPSALELPKSRENIPASEATDSPADSAAVIPEVGFTFLADAVAP